MLPLRDLIYYKAHSSLELLNISFLPVSNIVMFTSSSRLKPLILFVSFYLLNMMPKLSLLKLYKCHCLKKGIRIKLLKDFLCQTHSEGYNPAMTFLIYPTAVEAGFGCDCIMAGEIHWVTHLEYM